MIREIIAAQLPVGEKLRIVKNRIEGKDPDSGRIAIVSGIHGDEFEGQYVIYEMVRRLQEHPECLHGSVDLYPALNPLGMDMAVRELPALEKVAAAIVGDIAGADLCLDIHASNIFVREIPQVRISEEFAERVLPYAQLMNVDMVWTNAAETVHEATLAHSLNLLGVPSFVVEMGVGTRISRHFGNQVTDGIFHLMKHIGMWSGELKGKIQQPVLSTDGEVEFIRSGSTGVFLPEIEHNHFVKKGDKLGEVIDPLRGEVLEEILAQRSGLVFTLREYPFVREGALLLRILTGIDHDE